MEDCITQVFNHLKANKKKYERDYRFMTDMNEKVLINSIFTTEQAKVIAKIVGKYIYIFNDDEQKQVQSLLKFNRYKNELKQSIMFPREVRVLNDYTLLFRFRMNHNITEAIRDIKILSNHTSYIHGYQLWRVPCDFMNKETIMRLIRDHDFQCDDLVLKFFMDMSNHQKFEVETTEDAFVISTTSLETIKALKP